LEETPPPSKIDWARLLLDVDSTEDMLITVNREKIGQELLRLRSENARLTSLINKMGGGGAAATKKTPTLQTPNALAANVSIYSTKMNPIGKQQSNTPMRQRIKLEPMLNKPN
jgi:hypothetical protein